MHASATIQRSAWLLLLTFVVGTVLVPVVHHTFHPHGGGNVDGPPAEASLVEQIEVAPALGCIVCHAKAAAPMTHLPESIIRLPESTLISAFAHELSHDWYTSLPARAPPAA